MGNEWVVHGHVLPEEFGKGPEVAVKAVHEHVVVPEPDATRLLTFVIDALKQ